MSMIAMSLVEGNFGITRLDKEEAIPEWCLKGDFYSITKTADELSIVCSEDFIPIGVTCEKDWKVLKIDGPLDFSLVGILSSISNVLATQSISIFAISTYDTDYILVKAVDLDRSIKALSKAGYAMHV
jgi:uncharacterized protein